MAEFLDPNLLVEEGERMAQVLRMLEGFMDRPAATVRLMRPSLQVAGAPAADGGGELAPTRE